jgi:hypothetical protein
MRSKERVSSIPHSRMSIILRKLFKNNYQAQDESRKYVARQAQCYSSSIKLTDLQENYHMTAYGIQ